MSVGEKCIAAAVALVRIGRAMAWRRQLLLRDDDPSPGHAVLVELEAVHENSAMFLYRVQYDAVCMTVVGGEAL